MKFPRQDADDLSWLAIHPYGASNYGSVGAKAPAPIFVRKQNRWRLARRIVFAAKKTAQRRHYAQNRQRAVGNVDPPYLLRLSDAGYIERVTIVCADVLQRGVLLAIDEVN